MVDKEEDPPNGTSSKRTKKRLLVKVHMHTSWHSAKKEKILRWKICTPHSKQIPDRGSGHFLIIYWCLGGEFLRTGLKTNLCCEQQKCLHFYVSKSQKPHPLHWISK
jgi:hypothetical protein